MPKEVIEEKYRILKKYLTLLINEKDFVASKELVMILDALDRNDLVSEGRNYE